MRDCGFAMGIGRCRKVDSAWAMRKHRPNQAKTCPRLSPNQQRRALPSEWISVTAKLKTMAAIQTTTAARHDVR